MTAVPPRPAAGEVCRCGHPLVNHWQTGKRLCMACPDGGCPDFTPRPAAPDATAGDGLREAIAEALANSFHADTGPLDLRAADAILALPDDVDVRITERLPDGTTDVIVLSGHDLTGQLNTQIVTPA